MPSSTSPARARARRGIAPLPGLALGALLAATLLTASARWFWLGELAVNFRWHLGWTSLAIALALLALRHLSAALLALALALAHLAPEAALRFEPRDVPAREGGIEVASANVLFSNREFEPFIAWVEREDPDVLAVLELSREWKAVLEARLPDWPHRLFSPEVLQAEDGVHWGFALYSKLPFASSRVVPLTRESLPMLEAVVSWGGRRIVLRAVHPPRPGEAWRIRQRDAALERVAASAVWTPECALIGDLNVTSTSPAFARLVEDTGLRDSRAGFGRLPSWGTQEPLPGLSIAIDHCLVGPGLDVEERRTAAVAGSDHRAVIARLVPRATSTPSPFSASGLAARSR